MTIRKFCSVLLMAGLLTVFLAVSASAGLYWKTEQETKGMPGQPDSKKIVEHYYSEDASRTDMGDTSTIMNFKTMVVYQLDHNKKTYTQMDLKQMGGPAGSKEGQAFSQMMKQMMGETKVEATGETREIAGYNCKKYIMNIMMMKSEYWVTQDIKQYEKLKEIGEKISDAFSQSPMMQHMNFAAHVKQMDGFPVMVITPNPMGGGQSVSTLKHIEEKSLDPSIFKKPENYKQVQGPY
jgi:methylglyoxal synthase